WGDQTFFGENPPGAAIISWLNKKPVGEVKLVIKDAAGREVREISGTPLANSNKQGIQMACWDLRVQPNPAPPPAEGRGGRGARGARGSAGAGGGLAGLGVRKVRRVLRVLKVQRVRLRRRSRRRSVRSAPDVRSPTRAVV